MNSIGIFCGSANGKDPIYSKAASQIGRELAVKKIGIIYGGSKIGLMGIVANSALQNGGSVIGVIPQLLADHEIIHAGLTKLYIVTNMHERKRKIAELSDGFITMPGGTGTLEEIFEQWTWNQIGIHDKPCTFFNINNFYCPLQNMINHMVNTGFLKKKHKDVLFFSESISEIMEYFANYRLINIK